MKNVNVAEWLGSLPEDVFEVVSQLDTKKISILAGLNPSQVKAVMSVEGPTQINAVAGSGKTRVLVQRIAYMLACKIKPKNIMVTTFTKKATEEMTSRLKDIVPNMALMQMTIGTTHSIGFRILAKEYKDSNHHLASAFRGNSMLIGGKQKIFADKIKKSITMDRYVPFDIKKEIKDMPIPQLLKVVSSSKNNGKDHNEFVAENTGNSPKMDAYCEFFERYENTKWAERLIDADDLLFLLWKLFREQPDILEKYRELYKYLLVDEAQDNNGLQYEIFSMLSHKSKNIFIVGDDDQSMYGFRGARPDQFIHFSRNYRGTTQIALEDNYRSRPHILEVANSLIKNNTIRLEKSLKANNPYEGQSVLHLNYRTEDAEAEGTIEDIEIRIKQGTAPKDISVLYRTNAQSRALEDSLIVAGLPYVIHGSISFYERKEIKDLVSYLKLAINPHDDKAFSRVVNVPSRYLGRAFLDKVNSYNGSNWDAVTSGEVYLKNYEKNGVDEFVEVVNSTRSLVDDTPPAEIIEHLMNSFYAEYLREDGEDEEEGSSRFENIETLKFALRRYDSVESFLEYMDKMAEADKSAIDGVQLMTIHKSKGLEFKVTYVVGASQGLLPHFKAVESANNGNKLAIEEERRLLYVAITRAEEECIISSSGTFNGQPAPPSMFVSELGLKLNPEVVEEQLMKQLYEELEVELYEENVGDR